MRVFQHQTHSDESLELWLNNLEAEGWEIKHILHETRGLGNKISIWRCIVDQKKEPKK